jgi:hydroxymethylpyrimidine pyrophosphatase-like HAD family hydrolase
MEYGLLLYENGSKYTIENNKDFTETFYPKIVNEIDLICSKTNILFEKDKYYCDYPSHGGLWIEEKKIMLSLAANLRISPKRAHIVVKSVNSDLREHLRIIYHHLGVDILPLGWSKEKASDHFNKKVNTNGGITKWYVFGDNISDEEMCKPLRHFEYINTRTGASETTKKMLKLIFHL